MSQLEFWNIGDEISVREAFGRVLNQAATVRDDFVLFDADVAGGTGAKPFVKENPERVMQFGIAEQNMMAAAAGFADTGLIPVVSTFASFGTMRSHEQYRTAICFANRNAKLCCSHHGADVGPDGATAQCFEDLATMRAIPNNVVISPADANEFMQAFHTILDHKGPVYMRIGRSPTPVVTPADEPFVIGKAKRVREGSDLTIIATGVMVARALKAADELQSQGISARVVNMASIKPIDGDEIEAAVQDTGHIITAEDHNIFGGLGSAVAEYSSQHCPVKIKMVGVQDRFGKSGEHDELPAYFGIDAAAIVKAAHDMMKDKGAQRVA